MAHSEARYSLRESSNTIPNVYQNLTETLRHLRQERGGHKSSITIKHREIEELMLTSTDIEEFEQIQSITRKWLEAKANHTNIEDNINPEDSVSQAGKSSSSTSSLRLKAKAQKAALLAQAENLKKRQDLKLKQLELEQETERLTLEGQIKVAEAEEQVYANHSSTSGVKRSRSSTKKGQLNPLAKTWQNPPLNSEIQKDSQIETTLSKERASLIKSAEQLNHMLSNVKSKMDDMNIYNQTMQPNNTYPSGTANYPVYNSSANLPVSPAQINPGYVQPSPSNQFQQNNTGALHQPPLPVYLPEHNKSPQIPAYVHNNNTSDNFLHFQKAMLDSMHMPRAELITFDGDPLIYWTFMRSFESTVDNTELHATGKLTRLLQYCTGKAREVIKCCSVMEPNDGYIEAKRLLFERFGNPYTIAKAWISKVTEGESLKPNNGQLLRQFADDLRGCMLTLNAMGRLSEVDNQIRMVQITEKLPYSLQGQWRKLAVRCLRQNGMYPTISQLVDFVEIAAQEATDPVFGSLTAPTKDFKQHRSFTKKKDTIFAIQSTSTKLQKKPDISLQPFTCHFCQQEHPLLRCEAFQQLPAENRFDFVRNKQLCFNCFSSKHWSNNCTKNSRCSVNGCNKNHSRFLHDYLQNNDIIKQQHKFDTAHNTHIQTAGLSSHSTGAGEFQVALPIVLVKIKDARDCYIHTYALLDSGSTSTFCSEELFQCLGLSGHQTSLSLTTLVKDNTPLQLTTTSLQLTDLSGRQSLILPRVFATPHFPTLRDNVANLTDIRKWSHLSDIPFSSSRGAKVALIIGQDVPQALLPIEVRYGKPGEPYATRTMLGWSLNGPVGKYHNGAIVSNFVQAKDDLSLQVENFWKLDTCPNTSKENKTLSRNDLKVVSLWKETTTMEDGHFQMRIPFRNDNPNLPDNYSVAKSRLESLGRKLSHDNEKLDKYKQEIDGLIPNGYAERVPDNSMHLNINRGKIWYLPHHSVTNVNKLSKLRVVFDCAATFGGVSLNSEALQGLANNLFGVLLRFRKGSGTVMGDIQAMFHQVKVHPDDRGVLRFLWWQDGKPSGNAEIYRMTVHIFGGVWSPSCVNYALQLTAETNKDTYHPNVSYIVQQNFYVDDCLKSVSSDIEAIGVVKDLCSLLSRGGFQLNKWVRNDRTVLESVPAHKRATGLKSIDMSQSCLPTERALGVQWDIEQDSFGYSIRHKDKPLTRTGLLSVMTSVYDPLGFVSPYILLAKQIFQRETKAGKSWDLPLEPENISSWQNWQKNLPKLDNFWIDRCLFPKVFGEILSTELHHFSDASGVGYGVTSYIRPIDINSTVHCSLVTAKSRLAPIKTLTIPRLELTAAILATRMDSTLRAELETPIDKSLFWTDSEIVLRYMIKQDRRFQTFVAICAWVISSLFWKKTAQGVTGPLVGLFVFIQGEMDLFVQLTLRQKELV